MVNDIFFQTHVSTMSYVAQYHSQYNAKENSSQILSLSVIKFSLAKYLANVRWILFTQIHKGLYFV